MRLGVQTSIDFALHTAAGRSGVFSVAAAAVVSVAAVAAPRTVPTNVAVAGLAAGGVAARTLTGHFAASALGGVAVAH
jgi:putative copper resistance protein D